MYLIFERSTVRQILLLVLEMNNNLLNNRYHIEKQLSKKAGRRTFLAKDLHSDRLVVIKILLFDEEFQWDSLKLFEREAKTLQNLNHPAIPQYLDYFEVKDNNYQGFALVQTYIDAPSLEILIQQGRKFSENELTELASKLLDILNYLHGQNSAVIHRDIKPSNILIANCSSNSIGDIYLVDFGSVQTVASKESGTITIVGSYGYIPLEQFSGQAVAASDLYSLGMTIIYLATGIHPAEITLVNGEIKFNKNQLSKRFQKWLNKMIQPHVQRRFQDAKTAKNILESNNFDLINYSELKPKNTKINLEYEEEQLEIEFPALSESICLSIIKLLFCHLFSASVTTLVIYIFLIQFVSLTGLSLFWTFSILYLISYAICLWLDLAKNNKKTSKIIINNNEIIGYNSLGLKILNNSRSAISLLGYSPSYQFNRYMDSKGRQQYPGKVMTEGELFIYAGSNKYSIKYLTAAEFWWIGKELSEFLDLELQVIYPTPKVPPEPSSCGGCGC